MNRGIVGAIILAALIILAFVWQGNQPAAQGQKPDKAQQWEYRIYRATDHDFANDKAEAEFNKLAKDGWEFVETLVSRVPQPGKLASPPDPSLERTTCMLFRRVRK